MVWLLCGCPKNKKCEFYDVWNYIIFIYLHQNPTIQNSFILSDFCTASHLTDDNMSEIWTLLNHIVFFDLT